MSRAALALQNFSNNGGAITLSAPNGSGAGNGNTIQSTSGRCLLLINNGSSTLTPTVTVKGNPNPVDGIVPADATFSIPPLTTCYAIWLNTTYWLGGGGGGYFAVDISLAAGITWAAVELPTAYE